MITFTCLRTRGHFDCFAALLSPPHSFAKQVGPCGLPCVPQARHWVATRACDTPLHLGAVGVLPHAARPREVCMQSAPALAPLHFGAVGGLMPKGLGRRRACAREAVRSELLASPGCEPFVGGLNPAWGAGRLIFLHRLAYATGSSAVQPCRFPQAVLALLLHCLRAHAPGSSAGMAGGPRRGHG